MLPPVASDARFEGGPASAEPEDGTRTACPGGAPDGGGGGKGTGESAERVLLGVADDPDGCEAKLLADVTELDCTRCHLFVGAGGCICKGSAIVTCMGVASKDPMTPGGAVYVGWSPTGKGARAPAFDVVDCILDAIFAAQSDDSEVARGRCKTKASDTS